MSQVLKCDATAGDAYVEYDFGSPQSNVYVTVVASFDAAALAAFQGAGFSGDFLNIFGGSGPLDAVDFNSPPDEWIDTKTADTSIIPTPTANTWYTIEGHYEQDTIIESWVNGTALGNLVTSGEGTATSVFVGALGAPNVANSIVYIDSVKIGTTRGGAELFQDDFEDGTTDAWTATEGSATVIGNPILGTEKLWYIDFYNTTADDADPNDKTLVATVHPENLHFVKELGSVGTGSMDCEISRLALDDSDDPIVSPAFIGPYRTDFIIRRADLTDPVFAGIVTNYGGADAGEEHVKISGKGYLHYLERRVWPYDAGPDNFSYVNYPDGFRFKVAAADTGQIAKDIAEFVRDLSPNFPSAPGATLATRTFSLDYTVDADSTGKNIDYEIDAFDSESIYDKIRALGDASEVDGGFDFVMTVDKVLRIASPGLGDPGSPTWSLDEDNILGPISQTNTGPEATHVLGVGTGTSTKAGGVNKHFRHNSSIFRRLDKVDDFGGNIKSLDRLETLTSSSLSLAANPVHEVIVGLDPNAVNSGGTALFPDFWPTTNPGNFMDVAYTKLGYANLPNETDEPLKIISMDCTVSLQGDETVVFGLNQHFELSADAGLDDW